MATDTRIYVMEPRPKLKGGIPDGPELAADISLPTRYVRARSREQAAAFIAADLYAEPRVITDDDIEQASKDGRKIKVEQAKPAG